MRCCVFGRHALAAFPGLTRSPGALRWLGSLDGRRFLIVVCRGLRARLEPEADDAAAATRFAGGKGLAANAHTAPSARRQATQGGQLN